MAPKRTLRVKRAQVGSRLTCGLILGVVAAWSVAATPNLEFFSDTVRAANVTPNGCAVFFSVSHETAPWMSRVVPRVEPLVDIDGDGEIDYLPSGDLVDKSIWAVVDATTGDVTVSAPDGYTPQEVLVASYALFPQAEKLVDQRQHLDILIVRPGVGAWHQRIQDGGSGDHGLGSDGQVMTEVAAMDLIWSASFKKPLFKGIKTGDVVVGIDPVQMVYYQLEIGLFHNS